ncbi:hypothetical protein SGQ44_01955 [Flavobacterium sp. Fl-77]|uniref:tRNA_anti-like n=1 Tax=Flavobacterium flavipigmentatum TaxID=2893884 RepID=A0AAJ2S6L6_9FLAO|nr:MULTISPECIES: hypothetical protein [unclassified Flavobacterium]MDX6180901.1 hypothetical protein [Flavobacterium sp. Fl-33]MDX6184502.1 hypothetical protein [Flavobacterium sp. Fl-77]UFH39609.1 hypothetical protein LNP22_04850 [Flavobacterium sp. F-70]
MKKKIFIGTLIVLTTAAAVYFYTYQDHRNISTEKASYVMSISDLEQEFAKNDSLALLKYQDKTIELTAQVTAVENEDKALILEQKLLATFNDSVPENIIAGEKISIKGRFLGYDELLNEFKMDQSSIIE